MRTRQTRREKWKNLLKERSPNSTRAEWRREWRERWKKFKK